MILFALQKWIAWDIQIHKETLICNISVLLV
jgi:hypothetical protein